MTTLTACFHAICARRANGAVQSGKLLLAEMHDAHKSDRGGTLPNRRVRSVSRAGADQCRNYGVHLHLSPAPAVWAQRMTVRDCRVVLHSRDSVRNGDSLR